MSKTLHYMALIAEANARIEGYKARNQRSQFAGDPPFYSEDYFDSEANNLASYAEKLLALANKENTHD